MTIPLDPPPAAPQVPDSFRLEPRFDHVTWERIHNNQLGIDVRDPDGHHPGMAGVRREILSVDVGAWDPVDGYKHVLVGELDRYQFYNPWTSGDEADFNIFIAPALPFRDILEDVVAVMSPGERKELHVSPRGMGWTVECEITPDEKYYYNDWFPTRDGQRSPLIGSSLGVYGPWVRDWGHGGRPEIHPAEVIWWRAGRYRAYSWRLLILQDDSNRFDRPGDYVDQVSRPWSASPRRERITMALHAERGSNTPYYIRIVDSNRMFRFAGEGAPLISRNYEGKPALTVSKVTPDTSRIKVRLSELFPNPADANELRCFMYIDVQVGEGDRGEEGFAELWISKNELPIDPPVNPGAPPNQPVEGAKPTTRPGDGRPPQER